MASIKCYHCKETHQSVAEVRACAANGVPAASPTVPAFAGRPRSSGGATEKQVKFLTDLLNRKVHNFTDLDVNAVDKAVASRLIQTLLDCADRPRETITSSAPAGTKLPDVAAGWYAIDGTDGRETRFYRVDRPTAGRWAGRTFLKVQSSDDFWPVRDTREVERVLLEIAMDPVAAGKRYGVEIGRCCRCNRTLTDDESRAAGIGPICRDK